MIEYTNEEVIEGDRKIKLENLKIFLKLSENLAWNFNSKCNDWIIK